MMRMFGKRQELPEILFYNTLGKEKQRFKPIRGRYVKMYTCGPTVYDYAHIGNFRSYVFADTLRRVLEYAGYDLKQVMNITDFGHLVGDGDEGEDKMTAGLKREGMALTMENMKALAERYAGAFVEDLRRLNVEMPFVLPRASDHVPEQQAFVATLVEKGYAYRTSSGLYFDTGKLRDYGVLGGISASEEHSRIGADPEKRDLKDFVLWKFDPDLGWDAAWGKGFPGWHVECAAMATKYLGRQFDIHTGGIDHVAVHHNNEIAEAEAATGKRLAHYWMHNAFITVEGKRIGKSEGNAIRLYQLEERGVSPLAYRYLLLTAHYRSPMNFTWAAAEGAQAALHRAQRFFADLRGDGMVRRDYRERFEAAVNDDLNTPEAVAVMWSLIKDADVSPGDKRATMLDFDRVFGVGFRPPSYRQDAPEKVSVVAVPDLPSEAGMLLREREAARSAGDFAKADSLRDALRSQGFLVEDTKEGPVVRRDEG